MSAVYVRNRLPKMREMKMISPYELFYGYTSPIHQFQIFGQTAFARIAHRAPDKSEPRAEKNIS